MKTTMAPACFVVSDDDQMPLTARLVHGLTDLGFDVAVGRRGESDIDPHAELSRVVVCLPEGDRNRPFRGDTLVSPLERIVLAGMRTLHALLPALTERPGSAVVIVVDVEDIHSADVQGRSLVAGCVEGMVGLTKTLALEVATSDVTVNVILTRVGSSALAPTVSFLLSADARYVTGQTIRLTDTP